MGAVLGEGAGDVDVDLAAPVGGHWRPGGRLIGDGEW